MNGPEHYAAAQSLLGRVEYEGWQGKLEVGDSSESFAFIAAAQVHATLALAATTASAATKDSPSADTVAARWASVIM